MLIGTAGWSLPRDWAGEFAADGTHLQRYAARLPAVEINSSFHRPHRPVTYRRWAESVPESFRFSVKVPKEITHAARLHDAIMPLEGFLDGVRELGGKLGCLLVQLPPSLAFDSSIAEHFFGALRERYDGGVACEPRHPSWLEDRAEVMLIAHRVARVAADPARPPGAASPGGWAGLRYHRLHGSPRTYYSSYAHDRLVRLAEELASSDRAAEAVWCIFDNTAGGAPPATHSSWRGCWIRRRGAEGGTTIPHRISIPVWGSRRSFVLVEVPSTSSPAHRSRACGSREASGGWR